MPHPYRLRKNRYDAVILSPFAVILSEAKDPGI